jgi:cysteine desulfurase
MKSIYFDYAAATPLDPLAHAAMEPYWSEQFYNPSALYLQAKAVHANMDEALERMAHVLGTRASELIPTSGATEANNLVIRGIAEQYPGATILVSAIEHDSVLRPALHVGGTTFPVDEQGLVQLSELERRIDDKVVLISCMLVNNETGVLQPLPDIARLVARIRRSRKQRGILLPLYLHTDAAQAVTYMDCSVAKLGVDALTCNGGKIYGPKGTGLLYLSAAMRLQPQLLGGGQIHGLRSGTENVAGVHGLATALELVQKRHKHENKRVAELQRLCIEQLQSLGVDFVLHGSTKYRAPHICSIALPGTDNERVVMELDERGFCVATGSACSASSDEPSHVLEAMGIPLSQIRSTIRISFGKHTTPEMVTALVQTIASVVNNRPRIK